MKVKDVAAGASLLTSIAFVLGASGTGGRGQGSPPLGSPLPGLSPTELAAFRDGMEAFQESEDAGDGLGPVFNGTSCVECHNSGAPGGAASNLTVARVSRIGGIENGRYSDLEAVGGPVIQSRSLQEFLPGYPVPPEVIPHAAKFVSRRLTSPLFGEGLIEAIPASTILSRTRMRLPDGIHGMANIVTNVETGQADLGRFGWKAQIATIRGFAGDAYLNEMGITTELFPQENKPQGKPIPPGADPVADPEDHDGDLDKFTAFMRFLAPPVPRPTQDPAVRMGERVFMSIGCANCHVPSMKTGPNPIAALANKDVHLFSDLLLHRMGPGLADGIVQGTANGDQFRTAPLWGLSSRHFYLHDGRARTIEEVLGWHGGEASATSDRYFRLRPADRTALTAFLWSL